VKAQLRLFSVVAFPAIRVPGTKQERGRHGNPNYAGYIGSCLGDERYEVSDRAPPLLQLLSDIGLASVLYDDRRRLFFLLSTLL